MTSKVNSEGRADYNVEPITGMAKKLTATEREVIDHAQAIILDLFERGPALTRPSETEKHLRVLIGALEREVFGCVMLDNRNRVIAWRELFSGTIDGASVYPREVVKAALADNAAAVILAHNHPSGDSEPSQADIRITEQLKQALGTVGVRVLDHLVIGSDCTSLAERGLI